VADTKHVEQPSAPKQVHPDTSQPTSPEPGDAPELSARPAAEERAKPPVAPTVIDEGPAAGADSQAQPSNDGVSAPRVGPNKTLPGAPPMFDLMDSGPSTPGSFPGASGGLNPPAGAVAPAPLTPAWNVPPSYGGAPAPLPRSPERSSGGWGFALVAGALLAGALLAAAAIAAVLLLRKPASDEPEVIELDDTIPMAEIEPQVSASALPSAAPEPSEEAPPPEPVPERSAPAPTTPPPATPAPRPAPRPTATATAAPPPAPAPTPRPRRPGPSRRR